MKRVDLIAAALILAGLSAISASAQTTPAVAGTAMHNTSLFVLLMAITSQQTAAQTLPEKARSFLDQKYPGWELYLDTSTCMTQAVVSGDFDGNKKTDYSVRFQHGRTVSSVAFLSDGTEYKAISLPTMPQSIDGEVLTVTPKGLSYTAMKMEASGGALDFKRVPGQKLKTDTLTLKSCDSGGRTFYVYSDGEFKSVTPVD